MNLQTFEVVWASFFRLVEQPWPSPRIAIARQPQDAARQWR